MAKKEPMSSPELTEAPRKTLERFSVDKLVAIVEGYDMQLDQFSAFLGTKQSAEQENSLFVMEKTMKLMKELPSLIKARDSIAASTNGDDGMAETPSEEGERSAVQRKHGK